MLTGLFELDISCCTRERKETGIKWSNPQIGQTRTDFRFAHTFAKSLETPAVAVVMNSKKKNKNKQNKPPNPTPPQKEEAVETVIPPEEVVEIVDKVQNVVSENISEVKECEETPKKPKRNRGKKKKDDETGEKEDGLKVDDPIQAVTSETIEDALCDANITPTARKKKNKNKKNQEVLQEEKLDTKEVQSEVKIEKSDNISQEVAVQKVEELEPETKSSKKKNKKKKNRNDSERSEKEEVSVTSAFQQLLVEGEKPKEKNEKITKPTSDQGSEKEILAVPHENTAIGGKIDEEALSKDEVHKNKKKNKKDKKHPVVDQSKAVEDTKTPEVMTTDETAILSDKNESKDQIIVIDDTESIKIEERISDTLEQKSSKLKAKIAKPVEKKKKGKDDPEKKPECIESQATETSMPGANESKHAVVPAVASEKNVSLVELNPDWHEEVKTGKVTPDMGCENKEEKNMLLQPNENAEKNKKRKKSPKPNRRNEMPTTPEITTETVPQTIKTDEIKPVEGTENLAKDVKLDDEPHEVKPDDITKDLQTSEVKMEHIKATTTEKAKGKKSPKPQRKNKQASTELVTALPPEILPTSDTSVPKEISSVVNVEVKTEESPVQLPVTNIKEDTKKDETERIPTPDHEKRQKRKKSPKPPIDLEKASGSRGKSKNNVLNIDDIIIIQAEVVSDEKVPKGDTFVASGEKITSQDDTQKREVKPDSEKSKKDKKSPKPIKRDLFPDFKTTTDIAEAKDSHAEVQMPQTPKPTDTKTSTDTVPVEVELPKVDPIQSSSDVTPDLIEYPRCSSEQLLDSNNNTIIKEISNVETKLAVTIDIPNASFIRTTDLLTPESTTSGIKVIKRQTEPVSKSADEKTDLKSKVMEVNQDMEELRLSIERSLAELTSLDKADTENEKKMLEDNKKNAEKSITQTLTVLSKVENVPELAKTEEVFEETKEILTEEKATPEPVCPERKDRKGKGKSKKKGKQEVAQSSTTESTSSTSATTEPKDSTQSKDDKQEEKKSEQKSENTQEKGKQQSAGTKENKDSEATPHFDGNSLPDFEPIENFEDAMTSSVDDVNKTFEIIANEANPRLDMSHNNPEINVIAPQEDEKGGRQEKQNPVSPPKNLLGHPDIPVPSNRTDYKKEKNKTPNYRQSKVKIKDFNDDQIEAPEKLKQSKESQTESKRKFFNQKRPDESICVTNKNEDYVYKYSFRKVFLQCACHVCKKDLTQSRVPCSYCNLVFYCNQKHKDEDYTQHQALCFAVSTICHLKDQKFIYADACNVTGHNYRLLRMQTIVSSEKVLKRRLVAWEQEALLYPRVCASAACREWRQAALKDCQGCGQISYCSDHPDHLPNTHVRWCKSYNLYRSLVRHQQTQGRLEPKLPTRIVDLNPMPDNINEVLAAMYEERIDMSDIEYAALTQLATAPLTALYCLQGYRRTANGVTKKSTLTLHIVGAELQFEADVLNKWEVFLLHLVPHVKELRVVLVGPDLNPSNLPLELLGKIKLCDNCYQSKRRILFDFQDKRTYHEYWASDNFSTPDLICAFNPSIQRSSTYNGKDSWPSTIACILKLRVPFAITSYTLSELASDLVKVQECSGHSIICSPKNNSFASVRPDRNFISDDEAPLLFKNHCVAVVCGV